MGTKRKIKVQEEKDEGVSWSWVELAGASWSYAEKTRPSWS